MPLNRGYASSQEGSHGWLIAGGFKFETLKHIFFQKGNDDIIESAVFFLVRYIVPKIS